MEPITLPKPMNYAEALLLVEHVVYVARFIMEQSWPAEVAARAFEEALQGLTVPLTREEAMAGLIPKLPHKVRA